MLVVRPVKGKRVLNPITYREIKDGEKVPRNAFWLRRLKDGDIEIVEKQAKSVEKPVVSKKKNKKVDQVIDQEIKDKEQ